MLHVGSVKCYIVRCFTWLVLCINCWLMICVMWDDVICKIWGCDRCYIWVIYGLIVGFACGVMLTDTLRVYYVLNGR